MAHKESDGFPDKCIQCTSTVILFYESLRIYLWSVQSGMDCIKFYHHFFYKYQLYFCRLQVIESLFRKGFQQFFFNEIITRFFHDFYILPEKIITLIQHLIKFFFL